MIAQEVGTGAASEWRKSSGVAHAWHARGVAEILAALDTSAEGLDALEAEARLARFGPNLLAAPRRVRAVRLLVDQFRSVVVLLLTVAALVTLVIGDYPEAIAIGAVLLLNTGIGFAVELRARRAMEALLRLEVPRATVIRGGRTTTIDAAELVPGDVIELNAGDAVPADARLFRTAELRTNEASLTGESLPVDKNADWTGELETPLADRANLVYAGTVTVAGSARAIVVATGMATELGRIGRLIGGIEQAETPLERRLDALGKRLVWLTLLVAAAVTAVGLLQGLPLSRMLETGVALAVAAVPEGLPAVATIALAVGMARMARRRALIRRLHAVEALGSTTVVCTDKTGTLTSSQMTVTELRFVDGIIEVTGIGYTPEGELRLDGRAVTPEQMPQLDAALRIAALTARAGLSGGDGTWRVAGDPTDGALLVLARKGGLDRERREAEPPSVGELPFSSQRLLTASFHDDPSAGLLALVKGAPGRVLERSDRVLTARGERPLTAELRAHLAGANDAMAREGLRVIGLAEVEAGAPNESALHGLRFVALAGIVDPPAEGVKETLAQFRTAGIRTVMLTGDQRMTAEAIARDIGLLDEEGEALDGAALARLSEDELARRIDRIGAFSRVTPEDKLTIVSALQRNGEVVTMLGDGVNDAAALRKAEVGVAMGGRGTDVAKGVAAVILLDDRFPTIAAAIEEGRVIYDNIRKFVFYLFSCNAAEVLVLFLAGIAGLPLPLLPLQILWLNLVTDTFPALALALEPGDPGVMRRPPRDPHMPIISRGLVRVIGFYAGLITLSTLAAFLWGLNVGGGYEHAITLSFMTLALAQLFHLGNARSTEPVLGPRIFANRYAIGAVALVIALQLLAVYAPPLAAVLGTRPMEALDWIVVAPLAVMPAAVGQVIRVARSKKEDGFDGEDRP